jgi:hypothetical protein
VDRRLANTQKNSIERLAPQNMKKDMTLLMSWANFLIQMDGLKLRAANETPQH